MTPSISVSSPSPLLRYIVLCFTFGARCGAFEYSVCCIAWWQLCALCCPLRLFPASSRWHCSKVCASFRCVPWRACGVFAVCLLCGLFVCFTFVFGWLATCFSLIRGEFFPIYLYVLCVAPLPSSSIYMRADVVSARSICRVHAHKWLFLYGRWQHAAACYCYCCSCSCRRVLVWCFLPPLFHFRSSLIMVPPSHSPVSSHPLRPFVDFARVNSLHFTHVYTPSPFSMSCFGFCFGFCCLLLLWYC